MEPDAIQSTDAEGQQRALVLEPSELALDRTTAPVELRLRSDSRGISGCRRAYEFRQTLLAVAPKSARATEPTRARASARARAPSHLLMRVAYVG